MFCLSSVTSGIYTGKSVFVSSQILRFRELQVLWYGLAQLVVQLQGCSTPNRAWCSAPFGPNHTKKASVRFRWPSWPVRGRPETSASGDSQRRFRDYNEGTAVVGKWCRGDSKGGKAIVHQYGPIHRSMQKKTNIERSSPIIIIYNKPTTVPTTGSKNP